MYLPATNPVWSSLIRVGNTILCRLAMHDDPISYVTFSKDIGHQLCRYSLGLSPFGKQIIMPSFCVIDIFPFGTPTFKDLTTKTPSCFQKNVKKSTVIPSVPGLFRLCIFFSTLDAFSSVISPFNKSASFSVNFG